MRIVAILGLGVLGFLFAPPAQALTISNIDPEPHTVTIKAGSDSTELTIAPDTAVEPACAGGCTIELENGEQYEMKGGEEASIEGGVIFVDCRAGTAGGERGDARTGRATLAKRNRPRFSSRNFRSRISIIAVGHQPGQRRRRPEAVTLIEAQGAVVEDGGANPEIARFQPATPSARTRTRMLGADAAGAGTEAGAPAARDKGP